MFGLVTFVEYPHLEDYKLRAMEVHELEQQAQERAHELMGEFIEEYGGYRWKEAPSETKPFAIATNDEVVFRAYIAEMPTG